MDNQVQAIKDDLLKYDNINEEEAQAVIDDLFSHDNLTAEQAKKCHAIRYATRLYIAVLETLAPDCDQKGLGVLAIYLACMHLLSAVAENE